MSTAVPMTAVTTEIKAFLDRCGVSVSVQGTHEIIRACETVHAHFIIMFLILKLITGICEIHFCLISQNVSRLFLPVNTADNTKLIHSLLHSKAYLSRSRQRCSTDWSFEGLVSVLRRFDNEII